MSEELAEAPAAEPAAVAEPVETPVVAQPADDDAALDAQLEAQAIEIPDGDKLVPLSAVTTLRGKLKEAKAGSAEAATLREQLAQANQQLQAAAPLAEAFRAMQSAQGQQQPQVQQQPIASVEDTAELEDIARTFDFYQADGAVDLNRARKHVALVEKHAASIAQKHVAPLVQHTLTGQMQQNIARAKATEHPITKEKVPAEIIDRLVSQIQQQPGGVRTLADADSMKQIWLNAYTLHTLNPKAKPAAIATAAVEQQAPLMTERSGGQHVAAPKGLSASEKKAAKDAGLTEKQYLEVAAKMPW